MRTEWGRATMSQNGAEKLAQQIRAYWAKRGKKPRVRTVYEMNPEAKFRTIKMWSVRSDMIDGRPR